MNKQTKTLKLSRETIRSLSETELARAAGGSLINPTDPITARTGQLTCVDCLRR